MDTITLDPTDTEPALDAEENLDLDLILSRVRRGVTLFDSVDPNWRKEINTAGLDMSDGCNCIRGYFTKGSDDAIALLDAISVYGETVDFGGGVVDHADYPVSLGMEASTAVGDDASGSGVYASEYRVLRDFWIEAVEGFGHFKPEA